MPEFKTVAELMEYLHRRYDTTVNELYSNPEKWADFLSKSCYNFRLRFDQQVLIYAQVPNATIVATSDQWYKLYRPVKADSESIKVFEDVDGKNGRYTRYYMQNATKELPKSLPIPFWRMQPGYKSVITDALISSYDNFENRLEENRITDFEQQIVAAAEIIAEQTVEEYYDEILEETQDSELDKLDSDEIINLYTSIVANSVAFSMLSRLGYTADKIIDTSVFNDIQKFNTNQTLAIVGTTTQNATRQGLDIIAAAIRNYEREIQNDQTGIQRNDNRKKRSNTTRTCWRTDSRFRKILH